MYGVVRKLEHRPMLEIADSTDVLAAQLRAFSPQGFPHVVETHGREQMLVPSSRMCALFRREQCLSAA